MSQVPEQTALYGDEPYRNPLVCDCALSWLTLGPYSRWQREMLRLRGGTYRRHNDKGGQG